jgi:hypothetical protein
MMKIVLIITIIFLFLGGCTNPINKVLPLNANELNVVKLTDILVINESTCRGCAYENTVKFEMYDSLGILKLQKIITSDNNPENMDGGSIDKDLILIPVKTGITNIRIYKIWSKETASKDSTNYRRYSIDVRN